MGASAPSEVTPTDTCPHQATPTLLTARCAVGGVGGSAALACEDNTGRVLTASLAPGRCLGLAAVQLAQSGYSCPVAGCPLHG